MSSTDGAPPPVTAADGAKQDVDTANTSHAYSFVDQKGRRRENTSGAPRGARRLQSRDDLAAEETNSQGRETERRRSGGAPGKREGPSPPLGAAALVCSGSV
ncbi:hypothetical protein EYF80_024155 [Liparis tanakae]|uniref:Uncharacterized protein n=1 Tax=Liparis tanakae TaxID=230148 RepID=A0A4Z2HIJ3_9TELE|nr:hypothetical protein EYF80_024155 [Liparis tanakae]